MAGVRSAGRSRYTAAGFVYDEYDARESDLLIERDQAGSARDLMRDNNRIGYSAPELDGDGLPFSFFINEAKNEREYEEASRERIRREIEEKRRAREEAQLTLTERVVHAVHRERRAFALCCVLLVVNLTLLSFWGQTMIDGVRKRDMIVMYENGAKEYRMEIDAANVKIANAQNGERVRNKAQNELGMLRTERVATQTIYLQTSNLAAAKPEQEVVQESMGLLDWLLSVADILDFRS